MTKAFEDVGVIGSGTMGAGIAQVCALAGYKTVLYDISPEALENASKRIRTTVQKGVERKKLPENSMDILLVNLSFTPNLYELGERMELIIEAAPEDMEMKKDLFRKLDEICPEGSCFASNTSSLSITALGGVTKRPRKVAGLHFFNPVPQMKLVEVVQGKETDPQLVHYLCAFAESLGKTPVTAKDTPGFIVNRVARSFYGESFRLLDEGVGDVATLDAVLKSEGGFAMGPFELMDLIGIDINYAVTQSVYNAYFQEPRFKPHPIQRQMVEAGHLGRKTGQGFYKYD